LQSSQKSSRRHLPLPDPVDVYNSWRPVSILKMDARALPVLIFVSLT